MLAAGGSYGLSVFFCVCVCFFLLLYPLSVIYLFLSSFLSFLSLFLGDGIILDKKS